MSAPKRNEDNYDESLAYAPKWAREQPADPEADPASRAPWLIPSPPLALEPEERLPARRERSEPIAFTGDIAIKELQRRLALDPEVVPTPPLYRKSDSLLPLFVRFGLVVVCAGGIAASVVFLPPWIKQQSDNGSLDLNVIAALRARVMSFVGDGGGKGPRGPLEDRRPAANQAAATLQPIAVTALSTRQDAPPAVQPDPAPAPQPQAAAAPPARQELAPAAPRPVPAPPPRQDVAVASPPAQDTGVATAPKAEPAPPAAMQPDPAPAAAAPAHRIDQDEVANLVRRGQQFASTGDFSAARIVLRRAAEAGDARACLALGATYDPNVLKELGVLGFSPDVMQARLWYQKAVDLGSAEAARRLQQLPPITR